MGCINESHPDFNNGEFEAAMANLGLDLATGVGHGDFYPTYAEWTRDLSYGADAATAANWLHSKGIEGGERTAVYMLHPDWPYNPLRDGSISGELASITQFVACEAVPHAVIQRRLHRIAEQTAGLLFEAQLN